VSESEEGYSGTNTCVNISHFTFIAFLMGYQNVPSGQHISA